LSDEATSSDITTPLSTFQESSVPGSHWSASFFRIRICVKDPASVLLNISPLNWTADFYKKCHQLFVEFVCVKFSVPDLDPAGSAIIWPPVSSWIWIWNFEILNRICTFIKNWRKYVREN
jgi:hypothetical protein